MKPFTTLAVLVLALFAVVHLFRLIRGVEVIVGGHTMPVWASAVAAIVAAALALMVWRESRRP
jgi:hypothetical protein